MANFGTKKEQNGIADKPYYMGTGGVNATGNSILDMIGSSNIGTSIVPAGTFSPGKRIIIRCEGIYTAPVTTGLTIPLTVIVKIGNDLTYQAGFNITVASIDRDFWLELDMSDFAVSNGTVHACSAAGHLYYNTAALDTLNHKRFSNTGVTTFNTAVASQVTVQAYYTLPGTLTAAQLLNYSITALKAQIITNF